MNTLRTRAAVGRADLLRVYAEYGEEALELAALALGYERLPALVAASAYVTVSHNAKFVVDTGPPPLPERPAALPAARFFHVTEHRQSDPPPGSGPEAPDWLANARVLAEDACPAPGSVRIPVRQPLTRWSRLWPFLRRTLGQTLASRQPDLPRLLDRLTRLAAVVESTISSTLGRICAARAYQELVERRLAELREVRVEGVQTLREFVERRLLPAMSTCETVARLQDSLSERISRASELLRTRVDIALQRQNQSLLSTAARRAKLQLRLQETVEGLSVAAVSYYVVGLVGYAAKAVKAAGAPVNPEIVTGIAIPIVVVVAALGVRHIRQLVQRAAS